MSCAAAQSSATEQGLAPAPRYGGAGVWNHPLVNLRKVFLIFVAIQIVGWLALLAMQNGIEGLVR
jgi:hypothetical protein